MPERNPNSPIPAEWLAALGGLKPGDGGVRIEYTAGEGDNVDRYSGWCGADDIAGLLASSSIYQPGIDVAESYGALRRVLARHCGAKLEAGEVPQWAREPTKGIWRLTWGSGEYEQVFTEPKHDGWTDGSVAVPALSSWPPPLEAFAEAIAWLVAKKGGA